MYKEVGPTGNPAWNVIFVSNVADTRHKNVFSKILVFKKAPVGNLNLIWQTYVRFFCLKNTTFRYISNNLEIELKLLIFQITLPKLFIRLGLTK